MAMVIVICIYSLWIGSGALTLLPNFSYLILAVVMQPV